MLFTVEVGQEVSSTESCSADECKIRTTASNKNRYDETVDLLA